MQNNYTSQFEELTQIIIASQRFLNVDMFTEINLLNQKLIYED